MAKTICLAHDNKCVEFCAQRVPVEHIPTLWQRPIFKLQTGNGAAWRAFYLHVLDPIDTARDPRFPVYRKVCHLGFDPEHYGRKPRLFGSIGYERGFTIFGRWIVPLWSFHLDLPWPKWRWAQDFRFWLDGRNARCRREAKKEVSHG